MIGFPQLTKSSGLYTILKRVVRAVRTQTCLACLSFRRKRLTRSFMLRTAGDGDFTFPRVEDIMNKHISTTRACNT